MEEQASEIIEFYKKLWFHIDFSNNLKLIQTSQAFTEVVRNVVLKYFRIQGKVFLKNNSPFRIYYDKQIEDIETNLEKFNWNIPAAENRKIDKQEHAKSYYIIICTKLENLNDIQMILFMNIRERYQKDLREKFMNIIFEETEKSIFEVKAVKNDRDD